MHLRTLAAVAFETIDLRWIATPWGYTDRPSHLQERGYPRYTPLRTEEVFRDSLGLAIRQEQAQDSDVPFVQDAVLEILQLPKLRPAILSLP